MPTKKQQKTDQNSPKLSDLRSNIAERVRQLGGQVKKPEPGIHSAAHALAKEISEFCGEPKQFSMYLGIIKNIGLWRASSIFAEIKKSPKVSDRGKLFVFKSAYKDFTSHKVTKSKERR